MRRFLGAAVVVALTAAGLVAAVAGPAGAATAISSPTGNPFVVPGNAGGDPHALHRDGDGVPGRARTCTSSSATAPRPTAVGWDPTINCDLGSSPAPVVVRRERERVRSRRATPTTSSARSRARARRASSTASLRTTRRPTTGCRTTGACQVRVSTNNAAATTDQVFLKIAAAGRRRARRRPHRSRSAISDSGVLEGNANARPLTFTISLSRASLTPVSVDYATADQHRDGRSDYTAQVRHADDPGRPHLGDPGDQRQGRHDERARPRTFKVRSVERHRRRHDQPGRTGSGRS